MVASHTPTGQPTTGAITMDRERWISTTREGGLTLTAMALSSSVKIATTILVEAGTMCTNAGHTHVTMFTGGPRLIMRDRQLRFIVDKLARRA